MGDFEKPENQEPKTERVEVEYNDPGWQSIDDTFAWFDERKDGNWIVMTYEPRLSLWPPMSHLRVYGMPLSRPMVEVIRSGRWYGDEFKDYVICYLGVESDPNFPEYGQSSRFFRLFPSEEARQGKEVLVYIWSYILLARNVETYFRLMLNVGYSRQRFTGFTEQPTQHSLKSPTWDHSFPNMSVRRPDDLKKLADGFSLITSSRVDVQAEIEETRGGDWRSQEIKNMWSNAEVLRNFARKVDELKPAWAAIREMADPCDSKESEEAWLSAMLERPMIKGFMSQYPKLTKDILRRTVDSSLKPVNRERRQLAFFHAALEVEVNIKGETLDIIDAYLKYQDKPLAPTSLKLYYDKGKALLD